MNEILDRHHKEAILYMLGHNLLLQRGVMYKAILWRVGSSIVRHQDHVISSAQPDNNIQNPVQQTTRHTMEDIGEAPFRIGAMTHSFSLTNMKDKFIVTEKRRGVLIYAVHLCTELCKDNKDALMSLRRWRCSGLEDSDWSLFPGAQHEQQWDQLELSLIQIKSLHLQPLCPRPRSLCQHPCSHVRGFVAVLASTRMDFSYEIKAATAQLDKTTKQLKYERRTTRGGCPGPGSDREKSIDDIDLATLHRPQDYAFLTKVETFPVHHKDYALLTKVETLPVLHKGSGILLEIFRVALELFSIDICGSLRFG